MSFGALDLFLQAWHLLTESQEAGCVQYSGITGGSGESTLTRTLSQHILSIALLSY